MIQPAKTQVHFRQFLLSESLRRQRAGWDPYVIGVDALYAYVVQSDSIHPQFLARPLLLACKAITSKPKFRHVQPERIFFNKLCRFLYLPATFIFVFDGTQKPSMKRNKRGQVQEMWAHVRPLIHAFGFKTHPVSSPFSSELSY